MIKTTREIHGMSHEQFVSATHAHMEKVAEQWPHPPRPGKHPKGGTVEIEGVVARVDWGKWVVDCPHCRGAELVDFEDPRLCCMGCWNERIGNRWIRIQVPEPSARAAIEAALDVRPEEFQHWSGSTPVADLLAENRARGWK